MSLISTQINLIKTFLEEITFESQTLAVYPYQVMNGTTDPFTSISWVSQRENYESTGYKNLYNTFVLSSVFLIDLESKDPFQELRIRELNDLIRDKFTSKAVVDNRDQNTEWIDLNILNSEVILSELVDNQIILTFRLETRTIVNYE